jgi:hypothetical protein
LAEAGNRVCPGIPFRFSVFVLLSCGTSTPGLSSSVKLFHDLFLVQNSCEETETPVLAKYQFLAIAKVVGLNQID